MNQVTGRHQVAYFWHIPKTAGTSVRHWLASCLADRLCPVGIADDLVVRQANEVAGYHAFAGHFHSYLAGYLGREVVAFTLLRDPLDRTRSHWHEVRRQPRHPHYQRVSDQSFAQFVEDDRNRVMIENYQARYLTKLPINMATLASSFSAEELARYSLSEALEQASMGIGEALLVSLAQETLKQMAVVGLSERLPVFLAQVCQMLGLSVPLLDAVPRANVTPRDDGGVLPPELLAKLQDLTRIDRELHDAVARRVQALDVPDVDIRSD